MPFPQGSCLSPPAWHLRGRLSLLSLAFPSFFLVHTQWMSMEKTLRVAANSFLVCGSQCFILSNQSTFSLQQFVGFFSCLYGARHLFLCDLPQVSQILWSFLRFQVTCQLCDLSYLVGSRKVIILQLILLFLVMIEVVLFQAFYILVLNSQMVFITKQKEMFMFTTSKVCLSVLS